MLLKKPIMLALVALLGVSVLGCADSGDQWTDEDAQAEVEQLQLALSSSLDQADRQIQQIETRIEQSSDDVDEALVMQWHQTVTDLRERRRAIEEELEGIAVETRAAFDESQAELNEEMHDLEARIVEARLSTTESRAEYRAAAEREIAEIDRRIDALEMHVGNSDDAMASVFDSTLAEVREDRRKLDQEWEQLQEASDDEFTELRTELTDAIASLDRELNDATYEVRLTVVDA